MEDKKIIDMEPEYNVTDSTEKKGFIAKMKENHPVVYKVVRGIAIGGAALAGGLLVITLAKGRSSDSEDDDSIEADPDDYTVSDADAPFDTEE